MSAWNYPIQLGLVPLVGSIAAGNVSILKFSEVGVHVQNLMVELIPKYLDSRTTRVVHGSIPEAITLMNEKVDFICYTGSTRVGKMYHEAASKNFTPVLLEMGGKSPVFIDSNVDLAIAAKRVVWGKLDNSGQIWSRFLIVLLQITL